MRLNKLCVPFLFALSAAIAAQGSVVYVDIYAPGTVRDGKSWATAYHSLPPGTWGDEVWVAAGVYKLSSQFQMCPHTGYYGGFSGTEASRDQRDLARNVTVIDANRMSRVVLAPAAVGRDTVLDGFTLRNAYAPYSSQGGGGVACYGSPTIRNNIIKGLNIEPPSGGIYCAKGASPLIENNLIAGNGADGIYCLDGAAPVIRGNTIRDNLGCGIEASKANVTVTGNNISGHPAYGPGLSFYGCSIAVEGNTVRGNAHSGIYASDCTGSIARNRITGNAGRGGLLVSGGSLVVANNLIADNHGMGDSGGINCGPGSPLIVNNTIVGNSGPESGGVYIVGDYNAVNATPVLANNIIAFNDGGVVNGYYPGAPILRANCVYGNGADYVGLADPTGTNHNIKADPRLALPDYGNFHIQPGSPCVNAGNPEFAPPDWLDIDGQPRVQGPSVDIGADESDGTLWPNNPAIFRASPAGSDANDGSSWERAKRTAQAALEAAAVTGGGEVWLAGGIYAERLTVPPYTRLLGGMPGSAHAGTLVDAGEAGTVITLAPGATRVIVDNLSVVNGRAVDGAGILCCFGSASEISRVAVFNCIASSASADFYSHGGGVYADSAVLALKDSTVAGNLAHSGGGIATRSATLSIENCSLSWNTATDENGQPGTGGGLNFVYGQLHVTGSLLSGNTAGAGAGAFMGYPYEKTDIFQRCVFTDNVASLSGGGLSVVWAGYSTRVANCVFARNSAGLHGGGIMVGFGSPSIVNNTFVANTAATGGAVYLPIGAPSFENNIVAFNSSGVDTGEDYYTGRLFGKFNDLYGNTAGDFTGNGVPLEGYGNIHVDPFFADRIGGDYRLRPASPCVDAGDDSAVVPGETDADGRPRSIGRHVDIGAYESAFTGPLRWPDAIRALRIAAGLDAATQTDRAFFGSAADLSLATALIRTLPR